MQSSTMRKLIYRILWIDYFLLEHKNKRIIRGLHATGRKSTATETSNAVGDHTFWTAIGVEGNSSLATPQQQRGQVLLNRMNAIVFRLTR